MHVQIVLFDSFDPLDVIAPFEVLHAAGAAAGGALTVELVSAEGPRDVTSGTGGLALRATATLDPRHADWILVPGASGPLGDEGDGPGIPELLAATLQTPLPGLVRKALDDDGVGVASVCGGGMLLAMAGFLEGRHAVTHHLGMHVLEQAGATPVSARVVDDGDLVTAGGVTSGLDLALYLVARELGPRVALEVESVFAYERRGTVWRAAGLEPAA